MPIYKTITALTADGLELHKLETRDWFGSGPRTACGEPAAATSTDRGVRPRADGATFAVDDGRPPFTRPPCPGCAVVAAMEADWIVIGVDWGGR